jgi:prepilin-type N-terminal cleavage/methylation domain-containing protein
MKKTSRKAGFTLVEIMIVVAIIGLLAAIAIPNFVTARQNSQTNACINNLRQIDGAKQQWALENGEKSTDTPGATDLQVYLGRGTAGSVTNVACPLAPTLALGASGGYTINAVGTPPACPQYDATNHPAVLN